MTTERLLPAPAIGRPILGRPVLGRLTGPSVPAVDDRQRALGAPVFGAPVAHGAAVGGAAIGRATQIAVGTKPIRSTNARRDALLNTPTRAAMLVGVSAAVYAVSLAGVSALQFQTESANAAAQAPMVAAVDRTRAANDALEATLLAADAKARALETEYANVGTDATAFQQRLDELAALVANVKGSAATLPTAISLPTVKAHGAVAGSGKAPATSGVTSASGKP